MKRIAFIIISVILTGFYACSDDTTRDAVSDNSRRTDIEAVEPVLQDVESGVPQTRSGAYAVNTDNDPTREIIGREDWSLHVDIYDGTNPYIFGSADFEWVSGNRWAPLAGQSIYFPNYSRQYVSVEMAPPGWSGVIDPSQTTASDLFAQDLLEQAGNNTMTVYPAHVPNLRLRHANSMIDFLIANVDEADIASVTVVAGNDTYYPYKLPIADKTEYLVIIPIGVTNPELHLQTVGGAHYIQTLQIDPTVANTCYCITVEGIELLLSSISIVSWVYGEAIQGDYTTVTSYPTFRGPANSYVTLTYDNGKTQLLEFNSEGQVTIQASGRTVVSIERADGTSFDLDPPLVLSTMLINLIPRLDAGQ